MLVLEWISVLVKKSSIDWLVHPFSYLQCILYHVFCILCRVSNTYVLCNVSCILSPISSILCHIPCILIQVSCILHHLSCILWHADMKIVPLGSSGSILTWYRFLMGLCHFPAKTEHKTIGKAKNSSKQSILSNIFFHFAQI